MYGSRPADDRPDSRRRHLPAGLVLALSVMLASSFQGCRERPDAAGQRAVKLKVVYFPYMSFAPLLIAQEEGYFAEQNIEIEFISLTKSAHGLPSLVQGKLDVLAGTLTAGLLNSIAQGAYVRIVAGKGHVTRGPRPYTAMLVGKQLAEQGALSEPARLRGKRLLGSQDNTAGYFADLALRKLRLGPEDVELSYAPAAARFGAAEQGVMDLAVMAEPWVTRTVEGGYGTTLVSDFEVMPDGQIACVLFGPSLLVENPEAGRRFMVAYLKGVRQYSLGKTERNLALLAKCTRLDPELLSKAHWVPCHEDGSINVQSVVDFQGWAAEKGLVDRIITPQEFWDPSFAEYACEVLDEATEETE